MNEVSLFFIQIYFTNSLKLLLGTGRCWEKQIIQQILFQFPSKSNFGLKIQRAKAEQLPISASKWIWQIAKQTKQRRAQSKGWGPLLSTGAESSPLPLGPSSPHLGPICVRTNTNPFRGSLASLFVANLSCICFHFLHSCPTSPKRVKNAVIAG